MKSNDEIQRILAKSINKTLTKEEQEVLNDWLAQSKENRLTYRFLHDELDAAERQDIQEIDEEYGWQLLQQKLDSGTLVKWRSKPKAGFFRVSIAASFLLLAGIGYLAWKNWPARSESDRREVAVTQPALPEIIAPGTKKAMLTLADGSVITLDDAANGDLARQGDAQIKKSGSVLSYTTAYEKQSVPVFNTLATPVGGQYSLVLPDGSRVWLNAASALRFPAAFYGHQRKVELTGEAYFEIAHDSANPFTVSVKRSGVDSFNVQVLGTHFNISAYASESVAAATLLQGSVRITSGGGDARVLKPGQQAQVAGEGKMTVVIADTSKAIAWKNGDFQFNNDNIQTIMSQLERWYDIQVKYEGPKPGDQYTGTISRSNNLQDVLKMLEQSGLRFRITGRTVTISQ